MRKIKIFLAIFTTLIIFQGCVKRIDHYNPKKRDVSEIEVEHKEERLSEGSLWTERSSNASMFSEKRAHKINDIIQVVVSESDIAEKAADTNLERGGTTSASMPNGLGVWENFAAKRSGLDTGSMVSATSKNNFSGKGSTNRKETMKATITVVIKKVYSSGNLFIEGEKVTLVNGEEQHLYLSGIIRSDDISQDNSVPSDRIAELQIEFSGRGIVSDKQQPGVFARFFDWVWPF